uniref:rho guanine nucleotide exchange factor 1-like n=1 Tax=Pristiophorus japonicus TaxID=55135 RepID=UPI00398E70FD
MLLEEQQNMREAPAGFPAKKCAFAERMEESIASLNPRHLQPGRRPFRPIVTSVYNAVVTYMKFLGVRTKEPRALEKKRHFLMRRKGQTPKKDSEPVKPDEKRRKGIGSILDLRRQTRTEPSSSADLRPEGVKAAIDRKNSSQGSKSPLDALSGRLKSGGSLPEGSEVAGASGAGHALPREDSESDTSHPSSSLRPGNENQSFPDSGDIGLRVGPSSEQISGGEHCSEEGGESESNESECTGDYRRE